jgi:D-serine deaminase-like pyridoxal phosphate-dependent protein
VGLRPHTKTHKTPEVARLQLDRGALGLTVAKLGEAEVMAEAGLDDILLNHVCTCVNMHDEAFTLRNGMVVGSWRVAARGKIR